MKPFACQLEQYPPRIKEVEKIATLKDSRFSKQIRVNCTTLVRWVSNVLGDLVVIIFVWSNFVFKTLFNPNVCNTNLVIWWITKYFLSPTSISSSMYLKILGTMVNLLSVSLSTWSKYLHSSRSSMVAGVPSTPNTWHLSSFNFFWNNIHCWIIMYIKQLFDSKILIFIFQIQ